MAPAVLDQRLLPRSRLPQSLQPQQCLLFPVLVAHYAAALRCNPAASLSCYLRSWHGAEDRALTFQGLINQPLAASCRPLPRHTKAQSWHTQFELVTFLAQAQRGRLESEFVDLLIELSDELKTYLDKSLPA